MLTVKQNVMRFKDENGNMQDCGMLLGSPTAVITQITPLFAETVDDLNQYGDKTKVYVLPDGYVYAYKTALDGSSKQWGNTGIQFVVSDSGGGVTVKIKGSDSNPFVESSRLASDGSVQTSGSYSEYFTTPYIDLSAFPIPFTLHLNGANFLPNPYLNYVRTYTYDQSKNKISGGVSMQAVMDNYLNVTDENVTAESNGEGSITFVEAPKSSDGSEIQYIRFSAKGTMSDANIYITYTEEEKTDNRVSELNNEGSDPEIITLLPSVVKDFYLSDSYPDSDYTTSHLSKITYPFRADVPVPYSVKWNYREDAMRTTVAIDTKEIGTVNRFSMLVYDATGLNKFPIYNLIPDSTYYYKVSHVLPDGSVITAKSGSFKTSYEPWRMIYIDGTQNVRDLGGWSGLDGKKVKYGKIFRGASLSDSSAANLLVSGNGKRAMSELKIQAELNLGVAGEESAVSYTCEFKKIGYSNYASAITEEANRANFKLALETIVGWLKESTPRNIYIHCQGGCDRTGTLSFQLLGLLGVSESDLAKEYELSSFSEVGFGRLRTTQKDVDTYDYVGMINALKAYSGDSLSEKFYNFATIGCGISEETISLFRSCMLE